MRAIVYSQTGDPDVLSLVDRPIPAVGPGQVRVRLHVAGVNPTDWKFRRGAGPGQPTPFPEVTPGQDGAGVVDAVAEGVSGLSVGDRVWVWLAGTHEGGGTAKEYLTIQADQVVPLPDSASYDLGASLGVPALTAHLCLTASDTGPRVLSPGALSGRTVLVAGGAGAVGNAAIQLGLWAGAEVITTVSSEAKAELARAAGAQHIVNYRTSDAAQVIRSIAPDGVHIVVEVAPSSNAELNSLIVAPEATVAVYANEAEPMVIPVRPHMIVNTRYQFLMVYNVSAEAKANAVSAVNAAVAAGALRVGAEAGVPLHHYPLAETAAAHAAVESNVIGKVLLDLA
jgi:NADPH:quinone reductase